MNKCSCGNLTDNTKTFFTNPPENSRSMTIFICAECDNVTDCSLCGYPILKDGAYTVKISDVEFVHLDCYEKERNKIRKDLIMSANEQYKEQRNLTDCKLAQLQNALREFDKAQKLNQKNYEYVGSIAEVNRQLAEILEFFDLS